MVCHLVIFSFSQAIQLSAVLLLILFSQQYAQHVPTIVLHSLGWHLDRKIGVNIQKKLPVKCLGLSNAHIAAAS